MDSSIENARLIDEFDELSKKDLIKNYAEARAEGEAALMKQLIKERERKQQEEHSRKPK